MKIIDLSKYTTKAIEDALRVIKNGGLVIFPFDTCYGAVVDPKNQNAVKKLIDFKGRSLGKAISITVSDLGMASDYVEIPDRSMTMFETLLPGAFTIVAKGKHGVSPMVEAPDGSLGIRIPDYAPVLELVKELGGPITSTSANISGKGSCYSIESFLKQLSNNKKEMVDLIVDGGSLPIRKTSTVIDITSDSVRTLRQGDILVDKSGKGLLSESEEETKRIAEMVFRKIDTNQINKPIVLFLSGQLGGGKTVFSKQIGELVGVKDPITSPTFNIVNEYDINNGRVDNFVHFDLYRIKDPVELAEINFFDQFRVNGVACIEWPENMGKKNYEKLRKMVYAVDVWFEYGETLTQRKIWFSLGK